MFFFAHSYICNILLDDDPWLLDVPLPLPQSTMIVDPCMNFYCSRMTAWIARASAVIEPGTAQDTLPRPALECYCDSIDKVRRDRLGKGLHEKTGEKRLEQFDQRREQTTGKLWDKGTEQMGLYQQSPSPLSALRKRW
jgi:hypothetical protein